MYFLLLTITEYTNTPRHSTTMIPMEHSSTVSPPSSEGSVRAGSDSGRRGMRSLTPIFFSAERETMSTSTGMLMWVSFLSLESMTIAP